MRLFGREKVSHDANTQFGVSLELTHEEFIFEFMRSFNQGSSFGLKSNIDGMKQKIYAEIAKEENVQKFAKRKISVNTARALVDFHLENVSKVATFLNFSSHSPMTSLVPAGPLSKIIHYEAGFFTTSRKLLAVIAQNPDLIEKIKHKKYKKMELSSEVHSLFTLCYNHLERMDTVFDELEKTLKGCKNLLEEREQNFYDVVDQLDIYKKDSQKKLDKMGWSASALNDQINHLRKYRAKHLKIKSRMFKIINGAKETPRETSAKRPNSGSIPVTSAMVKEAQDLVNK